MDKTKGYKLSLCKGLRFENILRARGYKLYIGKEANKM